MPERRNLIRNQFSRTKTGSQPATKDQEAPTRAAVWQAENEPVLDGGNPPRPIRHFRMAERCTPDRIFESSPRSFGVGSKIGYHHHQPGRPATDWMLGEIQQDWQEARPKKMVLGLHRSHQIFMSS